MPVGYFIPLKEPHVLIFFLCLLATLYTPEKATRIMFCLCLLATLYTPERVTRTMFCLSLLATL